MLKAFYKKGILEAGIDEAGRGCYAGPVYAAAVILPEGYKNKYLNDSKKLSALSRNELRTEIEEKALAYAVASINHEEIDRINILQATYKAMHLAIDQLKTKPGFLLIDGNRFKTHASIPHVCVVKGDGTYLSIAAASILAKTYRDEMMKQLHQEFPHYGWDKNKGYGTLTHRKAIEQYGLCTYHRKSFQIIPGQGKLFL
jgi:ribonuclease HII